MSDQEYYDTNFVTVPAEATIGDALARLGERQAGDTWHIFADLGQGLFGAVRVGDLRKWLESLGADLFDLPLDRLVIPARAIPVDQATMGAPSQLRRLVAGEPAGVYVIVDAGRPVGRTAVASRDIFPGSSMPRLYGDYADTHVDARSRWRPAGIEPPTCRHCGHRGFFRYRVDDGMCHCTRCDAVVPVGE